MIIMIRMKDFDQFLSKFQLNPRNVEGCIICFDNDPNMFVIVGKHDYIEIDSNSFSVFLENVNNISAKNYEIKQLKKECAELKESLQSKYEIKDKQVIKALRYSVTKFALMVKASKDKKEMIETITIGVNDLLLFAENLAPEKNIKKLLDKKGVESA